MNEDELEQVDELAKIIWDAPDNGATADETARRIWVAGYRRAKVGAA